MINTQEIEKKWRDRWEKDKVFESNVNKKKNKFFLTFPYPYINAYPHIGHLYTLMRVEALARYKRMKGFNVLFPQGWHATGSPIVSAANRVKEKEEKQIKIMKDMGFNDKEIKKFEEPREWLDYFAPEFEKDFREMGLSIDWRRQFFTTDINKHYDKFIRWQFNKLKEKRYVVKGKFPVVWDPVKKCPVGDHDRAEGEGVTHKDFIWAKFKIDDSDLIIMSGTTRPDALYGQSNLWIDPEGEYVIVEVDGEKWVVGNGVVDKIKDQHTDVKVIEDIKPEELIGKWVQGPLVNRRLYILPAGFIDSNVGSGIVYSALEDPVDLYELDKIQKDVETQEKYNLDKDVVAKLAPISIIKIPGMGDDLGRDIGEEFGVKSAKDVAKLEKAKGELNKRVFRKGVMKDNCGVCKGMSVPEAQELLKKKLIDDKDAIMFYELDGKVVSRDLNECVIKIVEDQWFMAYGDKEWKDTVRDAFGKMKLYPEKVRPQFEYVIGWLHNWACTREEGLGTRLPWDEKWLIESLSDSTIYMAYYTIVHLLKDVDPYDIDDNFFDYVLLGKGKLDDIKVDSDLVLRMKDEFDYWYPVDFRNSGKDLVQNHLTFYVFNHCAIFPEDKWPKGIGVNGWVTVDGQKMSKSLGNMIPLRDMSSKFSVDSARFTILNGGEGMDDPNWDSEFAKTFIVKLDQFYNFCVEHYGKGREEYKKVDRWMESKLNEVVLKVNSFMEATLFRSSAQQIYFELGNSLRWYIRRCNGDYNKDLMKKVIESQLLMLSVYCPFICEEIWEKLEIGGYVSLSKWPGVDKKKINYKLDLGEDMVRNSVSDINSVLKLVKIKPKRIRLFVSLPWKYELFKLLGEEMKKTRNPGEVMKVVMSKNEFKRYGGEISKFVPKLVASGKVSDRVSSCQEEFDYLMEAKGFLEKEFDCVVDVIKAEDAAEKKALQAAPGKVGVLVD